MYDVYTERHLAIIRRSKKVKKLPYHTYQQASYSIKDKMERVKKGARLSTTE
jgi:hypothetical protein